MTVEINPDKKVSELLELHPMVLEILVTVGFTPLKFPGIRSMVAHTVTLREACAKREVDLDMVLERLHEACNEPGEKHG